jgi:hypothetical protein
MLKAQAESGVCRTRKLSAELTVTRAYWRKQNDALACGKILKHFWHARRKPLKILPHGGILLSPLGTSDCQLSR